MSTAIATTHKDIDLSARSFWAKPPEERDEAFAALRRENPVPWSRPAESDLLPPELNTKGFWSLTKMDDIRMASRHPEIFSSAQGITMEDFAPEAVEIAQSFIAMDAPRHTQLRGITTEAFKPEERASARGLDPRTCPGPGERDGAPGRGGFRPTGLGEAARPHLRQLLRPAGRRTAGQGRHRRAATGRLDGPDRSAVTRPSWSCSWARSWTCTP